MPILYFKNTEVWWSDENNWIHVLDTWGSALTHKQTFWAHTLELYSTLHFTLISAEGPVPEWVRPVVSVCQNRWTLDPLSAFPAKQMTCLLLPQPSFRLYIFYHHWASAHLLAALPLRQKGIKTVSLTWLDISVWVLLFLHLQPQWTWANNNLSCVFEFKLLSPWYQGDSWFSRVSRTTSTCTTTCIFSSWTLTLQVMSSPVITKTTPLGSTK